MSELAPFRIIVIDDNPAIHQDFIKILTTTQNTNTSTEMDVLHMKLFGEKNEALTLDHFEIDTASQGQEGVERIKAALEEGRPYSLAFVDIRMPPGWDGIETIKHIWALDKDIQVVICTAYSDYSWEETVSHLGKTDNLLILKKPFDNVSVRQLTCALTKKWQLLLDAKKYTQHLKEEVEDRTLSLQKSLSLVKATLESSNDGILVINNEKNTIDYNHRLIQMWEIPEAVLNQPNATRVTEFICSKLLNPEELQNAVQHAADQSDTASIVVLKLKDGQIFESYTQPQILNDKIVGKVFNFRDITKRAKLEKQLQYQATHDALTDLPNRVMLLDKLKNLIKTSKEKKQLFAVMFLDLDRFKLINDSLSHAVGDELLQETAKRLLHTIRPQDMLARLGGDEFVIILADIQKEEEIIALSKNILRTFQAPFHIANREVTITSSIGISIYPTDGDLSDILLRNADLAMYGAKEKGANNIQYYAKEMNIKSLEKLDQEMEMRKALNKNEFFLCYQPQFDLDSHRLIAAEALIRWQHPSKGVLLPMDFIPLAEETGLIIPIGEWALRTACKQHMAWQRAGLPPVRVAVNVSAYQLRQQNFIDTVKNILEETKIKPEYLELELTENVIISSTEVVSSVTALKKLGVVIAVDDFGTGYSGLSYLRKLPLDRLKIDSSFVSNIKSEGDDDVIIRAIISVAKNLNLEVLAEGVETQNQINFLKNNNCREMQGYYFSKPLSSTDFEALLKDGKKLASKSK
jgi:diguanylate cyclase (GGDEF)-like protein